MLIAFKYGFPSKKMVIIGVTGTKGKTSTTNFIWASLMAGGYKTGIISTANIRIGNKETLNPYHMSMPKPAIIQKILANMVKEGCTHCVVETTSQGIKSFRHVGIDYDIVIFTNLSPEHLLAHNKSFDTYKKIKGALFKSLFSHKKVLQGKKVPKISIINRDSEFAEFFLNFRADKAYTFSILKKSHYQAHHIQEMADGVNFSLKQKPFHLCILGKFNVYNALPAIIIGHIYGINNTKIEKAFEDLLIIPGRMEVIKEGQKFIVIVDYAHEKCSMTNALQAVSSMKFSKSKIIVLLGAEGGGRDTDKRPIMGELAGQLADYVIVSNVDPYRDDPKPILDAVAKGAEKSGKVREKDLFVIEDRRLGIKKALSLAHKNDIVLITGKGAEQSMKIGGDKISWDDRIVVKEELKRVISLFDI